MTCNFAIAGADTLLGQALIDVLIEANFPATNITTLLTGSIDQWAEVDEGEEEVEEDVRSLHQTKECFIDNYNFTTADIVFIAGDKSTAANICEEAINADVMVIDLSGYAAEHDQHPLVLSSINSHEIQGLNRGFIVAVPSPAAALLVQVLHPLQQQAQLERISVTHFEPAAGLGKLGVDALAGQTVRLLNGLPIEKKVLAHQLAFNVLPQCGAIDDMGYAEQERRLVWETKQLLNDDSVIVSATCIQAPVFYAQSQVVDLVFAEPVDCQSMKSLLRQADGITVVNAENATAATIKTEGSDDLIFVSRMRQADDDERSLTLWCAADSLRRCAAVNAVQIAEILIKSYL